LSSPKNAPSGARIRAGLALAALLCAALPAQAADETYLRPMIDVEQSWDSNIYNDSEGEQSSLITTISPGLWFENRGELGYARAGVTARGRNVWEESDLTGIDLLTRGDFEHKLTPRLALFGDGLYDRYSGYDQISDAGSPADPGNVLLEEQPRWVRDNLGAGFRYLLTERLSYTLRGYAGRVNYDSSDVGNTGVFNEGYYRDRTQLGGSTRLLYQLTAHDQVMLDVGLDETEYQDLGAGTNESSIWNSEIGWSHTWTQFFSSTAKIGFSSTDSEQTGVPQFATCEAFGRPVTCPGGSSSRTLIGESDFSTSGSALIGTLSLRRVFARGFLELAYNRSTRSTGGSGRTDFDIDSFTLSFSHRLAERVRLTLTGNYSAYHSVSDDVPNYAPLNGVCRLGGTKVPLGFFPPFTAVVQCVGGSSEEKRHYTTLVGKLEWQLRRRLSSYVTATYNTSKTDQELGNFGDVTTQDLDKFTVATGFRWYHDLGL